MKFILATKEYMTTYFAPDGRAIPVTVVHAGPITVTQVKTQELDGYDAIQYGSGTQKESRMTKAEIGHLKELQKTNILREVRLDMPADVKRGDTADVSLFTPGDVVSVSGISKGKGFQGVVKRYNFAGGRRSHGQKHSEREGGSIGGGLRSRVPKGMRMPGRMGTDMITVTNLEIIAVESETGTMLIKGALPGRRGTLLEIKAK
ncbi:50S ribosomal protein L3 [Candidatus Nomurabacteria bacterium]|jgi:large subunit ribosomal protein L3|nr:MAG: 50S ribosomal protein L3 [Candidatus Nomurabacteria bacterium]